MAEAVGAAEVCTKGDLRVLGDWELSECKFCVNIGIIMNSRERPSVVRVDDETGAWRQAFTNLVHQHLRSPAAQTVRYSGGSKVGQERLVCGHSSDGQVSFVVRAMYHSNFAGSPFGRRDFVGVVFLDRRRKVAGELYIASDADGFIASSDLRRDVPKEHIASWDEGEAFLYYPIGSRMEVGDIQGVIGILQSGVDDAFDTEKALKRLYGDFPYERVNMRG